mgnify:CR=1 FL=1
MIVVVGGLLFVEDMNELEKGELNKPGCDVLGIPLFLPWDPNNENVYPWFYALGLVLPFF